MSAEHALHVLTPLPLRIELVFSFGMCSTLPMIVCPQVLQAAQSHQLEWSFQHLGGESHKIVGGRAKACDMQGFRSGGIESGGRSECGGIVHGGEVDVPIGILPVADHLLFKIQQRDVVRENFGEGSVEDGGGFDRSVIEMPVKTRAADRSCDFRREVRL